MNINFIGLIAALTTFFSIWMGHVLVRKIERHSNSIKFPAACFVIIGIFLQIGSFLSASSILSTTLGIFSMTTIWDSFELFRQQKRVIKGRSPANPSNPRHAQILKQHQSATTVDLLKRDPVGYLVNVDDALNLAAKKGKL